MRPAPAKLASTLHAADNILTNAITRCPSIISEPIEMSRAIILAALAPALFAGADASFLNTYCASCHQGVKPTGGFAVAHVDEGSHWNRVALRVRNMEMPPKGAPAPPLDVRERFLTNVETALH